MQEWISQQKRESTTNRFLPEQHVYHSEYIHTYYSVFQKRNFPHCKTVRLTCSWRGLNGILYVNDEWWAKNNVLLFYDFQVKQTQKVKAFQSLSVSSGDCDSMLLFFTHWAHVGTQSSALGPYCSDILHVKSS